MCQMVHGLVCGNHICVTRMLFVFVSQCKCLDPKNQDKPPATCGSAQYKGDGNCDDDNNNKGCEFDGGDCCAKSVKGGKVKKDYCKAVG